MSLLLDHGHPEADEYPIGLLRDEFVIVVERENNIDGRRAMLAQAVASTVPNMSVKPSSTSTAQRNFSGLLRKLTGG